MGRVCWETLGKGACSRWDSCDHCLRLRLNRRDRTKMQGLSLLKRRISSSGNKCLRVAGVWYRLNFIGRRWRDRSWRAGGFLKKKGWAVTSCNGGTVTVPTTTIKLSMQTVPPAETKVPNPSEPITLGKPLAFWLLRFCFWLTELKYVNPGYVFCACGRILNTQCNCQLANKDSSVDLNHLWVVFCDGILTPPPNRRDGLHWQ